ncbi:efflux RND transporter periplasmic adaptor subunit [Marinomonas epiphytica]
MTIRELNSSQPSKPNKLDIATPALKLLQFEADVRHCNTTKELIFDLANHLNTILPYEKAFIFAEGQGSKREVVAASAASYIEKSSPLIKELNLWAKQYEHLLVASSIKVKDILSTTELPYSEAYWLPIKGESEEAQYYLLLFASKGYTDNQKALLQRLAFTYQHAFRAVQANPMSSLPWWKQYWVKLIVLVSFIIIASHSMPINVLAPVEVVANKPFIVTAPFNGVVKEVVALPNSEVTSGDIVVEFEDLELRNEFLLSQRKLAVAKAKYDKAQAASFVQISGTESVAVSRAELNLALIESEYAREKLAKSVIRTPQSGVVIYNDKEEWQGKAVQVGERLMQVADTGDVRYRISVPTGQMMEFNHNADIMIYLDNSPLGGHTARLESIGYQAVVTPEGVASYILTAMPSENQLAAIGTRGTARIYGEEAPLIWHLIRRPVNSVRQWLGV